MEYKDGGLERPKPSRKLPRLQCWLAGRAGGQEGLELLSRACLVAQSSLGSGSASSFQSHVPYSPFRGMPPYGQLAASSLLSQQYAASLGLGE